MLLAVETVLIAKLLKQDIENFSSSLRRLVHLKKNFEPIQMFFMLGYKTLKDKLQENRINSKHFLRISL